MTPTPEPQRAAPTRTYAPVPSPWGAGRCRNAAEPCGVPGSPVCRVPAEGLGCRRGIPVSWHPRIRPLCLGKGPCKPAGAAWPCSSEPGRGAGDSVGGRGIGASGRAAAWDPSPILAQLRAGVQLLHPTYCVEVVLRSEEDPCRKLLKGISHSGVRPPSYHFTNSERRAFSVSLLYSLLFCP